MNPLLWKVLHPRQALGGRRYNRMVTAPLRPETVAALADALRRGDVPVRKVRIHER